MSVLMADAALMAYLDHNKRFDINIDAYDFQLGERLYKNNDQ